MKTKLEIKQQCDACAATRKKNELVYDAGTFKAYCTNISACNDKHPNSYQNFAERGALVPLVSYSVAAEEYRSKLLADADKDTLRALELTEKPTTIRFENFELAKYVMAIRDQREMASMNAVIMDIIKDHMTLMTDSKALIHSGTVLEQKQEEIAQQQERIEELTDVNKPVYKPEDEEEGDVF